MVALRSSAIADASYDPQNQVLMLTFTNGRTYTYDDVPEDVYDRLVADPSPGRFFLDNIKDQY